MNPLKFISALTLGLLLGGCATHQNNPIVNDYTFPPIPPRLRLLAVDRDKTELWQREDGTTFVRFETVGGAFKTYDANDKQLR